MAILDVDGAPAYVPLPSHRPFPNGSVRKVVVDASASTSVLDLGGTTDDPRSSEQWGLRAVAAPAVWEQSAGASTVVAVLDTGVDGSHPDLAGRVLPGIDMIGDGAGADPNGHGTHVAGIIAAVANNGIGVAGAAPEARILPVRVLDSDGYGDHSAIASGIVAAVDYGADVINLSLGGTDTTEILASAVDYATAAGVVVVAAAGNERQMGNGRSYPAAYDNVIGVGAISVDDRSAMFSNTGDYIDIAAPGFAILSTLPGGYGYLSGTSQAAPYVAAAAALAISAGVAPGDVPGKLARTARDVAHPGRDQETGAGVLDVAGLFGVQRPSQQLPFPVLVVPEVPALLPPTPDGSVDPPPTLPPVAEQSIVLLQGPPEVTYGEPFTAMLVAGRAVTQVAIRPPGGQRVDVQVGGADQPMGPVSVTLMATVSGRVEVLQSDTVIASYDVLVHPSVTVTARTRTQQQAIVRGSVTPTSERVHLERLVSGEWVRVASAAAHDGRFTVATRASASGIYRITASGGMSTEFRL